VGRFSPLCPAIRDGGEPTRLHYKTLENQTSTHYKYAVTTDKVKQKNLRHYLTGRFWPGADNLDNCEWKLNPTPTMDHIIMLAQHNEETAND